MILLLSTLHVSPIIFLSSGLLRKSFGATSQENVAQNITESRGRRCGSIAQLRSRNSDRVDSRKSRLSQIHDPPIFHLTPPLLRQHNPQKPSIIGFKYFVKQGISLLPNQVQGIVRTILKTAAVIRILLLDSIEPSRPSPIVCLLKIKDKQRSLASHPWLMLQYNFVNPPWMRTLEICGPVFRTKIREENFKMRSESGAGGWALMAGSYQVERAGH